MELVSTSEPRHAHTDKSQAPEELEELVELVELVSTSEPRHAHTGKSQAPEEPEELVELVNKSHELCHAKKHLKMGHDSMIDNKTKI